MRGTQMHARHSHLMAQDACEGRDQTVPSETIANATHSPDPKQGIALRAAQSRALAAMVSPVGAAAAGLACGRWLVRGR